MTHEIWEVPTLCYFSALNVTLPMSKPCSAVGHFLSVATRHPLGNGQDISPNIDSCPPSFRFALARVFHSIVQLSKRRESGIAKVNAIFSAIYPTRRWPTFLLGESEKKKLHPVSFPVLPLHIQSPSTEFFLGSEICLVKCSAMWLKHILWRNI